MDREIWLGFAAAALVMGIMPGPGVMSILGYAIGSGRRVALVSVLGMAIGNMVAMTLSLAGVGALLAASALAFTILKWAGALYLIGLGVRTLLQASRAAEGEVAAEAIGMRTAFLGNLAIGTFHPKTIVFFVAFAPQFIMPDRPYLPQAALLVMTFCGVVAITDGLYAVLAARAAGYLSGRRALRWSKRVSGLVLIGSGLATAATRK